MNIHPYAWMTIGAVVSVYSKVVEAVNDSAQLTVFFALGILFIITGIAKKFMDKTTKTNQPQQPF